MSNVRILFNHLHAQLKNPEITDAFKTQMRKNLKLGNTSRLLDDLPIRLLPDDSKAQFSQQFKTITSKISIGDYQAHDDQPKLEDKNIILLLKNLTMDIANIGFEFFDDEGRLKEEFVKLFGWEEHKNRIKQTDLLVAFVGSVILEFGGEFPIDCEFDISPEFKEKVKHNAANLCISRNIRTWIEDKKNDIANAVFNEMCAQVLTTPETSNPNQSNLPVKRAGDSEGKYFSGIGMFFSAFSTGVRRGLANAAEVIESKIAELDEITHDAVTGGSTPPQSKASVRK